VHVRRWLYGGPVPRSLPHRLPRTELRSSLFVHHCTSDFLLMIVDVCGPNCKDGNCISTSLCQRCRDGFMGTNCEVACPTGYHGENCLTPCLCSLPCLSMFHLVQTIVAPTVCLARALATTDARRASRAGRAGTARTSARLATRASTAPVSVCSCFFSHQV
jgi:hypothetical protein